MKSIITSFGVSLFLVGTVSGDLIAVSADADFGSSGPLAGVMTTFTFSYDSSLITPPAGGGILFAGGTGHPLNSLALGTMIGSTTFNTTNAGVDILLFDSAGSLLGFRAGGFINGISGVGPNTDDFVVNFRPPNQNNVLGAIQGQPGISMNGGGVSNFQVSTVPEPSAFTLFATVGIVAAVFGWRRRRQLS